MRESHNPLDTIRRPDATQPAHGWAAANVVSRKRTKTTLLRSNRGRGQDAPRPVQSNTTTCSGVAPLYIDRHLPSSRAEIALTPIPKLWKTCAKAVDGR